MRTHNPSELPNRGADVIHRVRKMLEDLHAYDCVSHTVSQGKMADVGLNQIYPSLSVP
jgi:hypothetical protein